MKAEIVTYTGKLFDILDPKPELICIEDIAHALSNICRYTGHTRSFYSVAEHSVRMAKSPELEGDPMILLLHDAAEAYFGDIATPLKKIAYIPDGIGFRPIYNVEAKIIAAISEALDINLSTKNPIVKLADKRIAASEVRDLMVQSSIWDNWLQGCEPLPEKICPWTPARAETEFLMMYNDLADDSRKLFTVEEKTL